MEGSEGMVAVVRGLKDSGLAVTLLDSGRQYTLLPEAVTHPVYPRENISQNTASSFGAARLDSGVQATDGRYASTYQMMHCNMVPTSPPDLVTEFPPQRAELYPGHENFEIGGTGSGETYCLPTRCSNFRGGLIGPDRGSVFSSKPSVQPDSFTSSLRKYPNMSQERSSEIVERLITFTQAKNASKYHRNTSPTRVVDSDISNQTFNLEANISRYSAPTKCPNRGYEPEACIRSKRLEESPTRDKCRRCSVDHETLESWRRSTFCKTNDVRYLREVSRKVRDGIRSLSYQPHNQPEKINTNDWAETGKTGIQSNTNAVNMEIQAAVPMVSREVVTVPIPVPSQRTIAIPITPSPSCAQDYSASDTRFQSELKGIHHITKTIVPKTHAVTNVQTATSTIELSERKCNKCKRSKSQDELRIMHSENLDTIQDYHLEPCCSKFYRKSHNRINRSNKFFVKLAKNCDNIAKHNSIACEHRIDLIANNSNNVKRSLAQSFRAEVPQIRMTDENDLAKIVKDWLNLIPLKPEETFERTVDKEIIFYDFFNSLKYFLHNSVDLNKRYELKLDILDKLNGLPIETKCNRSIIENRLADILINKIKHLSRKNVCKSADNYQKTIKEFRDICSSTVLRYVMPTEDEINKFIATELMSYLEKSSLKINRRKINKLEKDLFDYFILFMEEIKLNNDKRIRKNMIQLLKDFGLPDYQAISLTNTLITDFKESFVSNMHPLKVRSETFIVLQNLQNVNFPNKSTRDSEVSIENNRNQDIFTDLDIFNNELCREIDEWMTSLQLRIPEDSGLKQVVINDLAGDIIDRYKYLELNPASRGTEETELEHLKYQIFKWINKLVGVNNLSPTENASELMRRIRGLTIPIFVNSRNVKKRDQIEIINDKCNQIQRSLSCGHSICDMNIRNKANSTKINLNYHTDGQTNINETGNTSFSKKRDVIKISDAGGTKNKTTFVDFSNKIKQSPTAPNFLKAKNSSQSIKSIGLLEAEYEQYVKDWVHKIPIKTTQPEDESVAEKVRLDMHNSLWKIVSKLSYDPATYYNRFFFEDILDDAIDNLLDCLPQNSDLKSQRNRLKLEFIEKTANFIDNIKANQDASFKHKLVRNVIANLREEGLIDKDCDNVTKEYEDLRIIKLVEEYLLYTRFKNDDVVISEVFKKKLLQGIDNFIEDLKKNHIKELNNIDLSSCKTDILNILQKVPLPNEISMKEEADDILLARELEQWYSDLPIILNNDPVSLYQRKKQLELLTNKIKEMINNTSVDTCVGDLRNEVSRFLEKMLFTNGDNLNINFMVDKLVNRINNIKKQDIGQTSKRVAFQAADNYEEFEKGIPYSSSFNDIQPIYNNLQSDSQNDVSNKNFNQTSKCEKSCHQSCLINISKQVPFTESTLGTLPNKKTIVPIEEPPDNIQFPDERPVSSTYKENNGGSNQWFSLRETQIPAMTQSEPQDYKIFETNNDSENDVVHQSNQSYRQNKNDKNQIAQHEKISGPEIKTTRGISEISQVAGPSGYKPNYIESSQNCIFPSPSEFVNATTMSSFTDCGYKELNKIKQQENLKQNNEILAERKINESINKSSVGCQVLGAEDFDKIVDNNSSHPSNAKQLSVATTTSSTNISTSGHPFIQKKTTSTPSGPTKKRAKWPLSERDTVQRRLRLIDSDDGEDNVHCRCIERYWKCRRRPKYFSCEDFDDLPPCLPVLFPYPCFF